MNQQQQQSDKEQSFDVMLGLASAQAACLTPFLRTKFGEQAAGKPMLGGAICYWLWILATHSPDLINLGCLWLGALFLHRIDRARSYWRGEYQHSWYDGQSSIFGRWCSDDRKAKIAESIFVICLGFGCEALCPDAVGKFLIACGFASLIVQMIHGQVQAKRIQAVLDAELEAEWLVQQATEQRRRMGRG